MKFTTWASAFKKKPKNVHHVAGLTGCALRLFLVKLQGCDRKLCFFNSAWLYIDHSHSEGSCSNTAFFILFIEKKTILDDIDSKRSWNVFEVLNYIFDADSEMYVKIRLHARLSLIS